MPGLTNVFRLRPGLGNVRLLKDKPKTADEINTEYDRLEYDLLQDRLDELRSIEASYWDRLARLREMRRDELAKVPKGH